MPPYQPVDPAQSFPELEQRVLERWRERDVFRESMRRREGSPPFVFYEGPPTANGRPGVHHVLSRVFKDVFPRFKTMRGHFVPRKGGWDCHGLPVELEVEKELGFQSKADIERYGVAEFNAKCRESVLRYIDEWNALTERIGFWVDTDDAYFTLSNDYIESVWWSLKETWDKGLLTEGYKVVPYCPRDGTALSSHEVALGYENVIDPSVYVKFPLLDDPSVSLLAWTTMPWTLVPHAAIAVDPDVTYARARLGDDRLILAEALVERVLGEEAEIEERMPGSALLGLRYEPPFPYISDYGEKGHTVLAGDFVSVEDGTGVVHTGAAFGEDDFRLAQDNGLTIQNPVRPDGSFDESAGPFAGMYVRAADPEIIEALRESGRLFRAGEYEHSYPHCWRCGTPLIYYAKTNWYVRTTEVKDQLLAANETIKWYPDHIKHGRFGKWLENNVDWALSRERYWGTRAADLALRRGPRGLRGLARRDRGARRGGARRSPPPPHRRDRPALRRCGSDMRRVPDLIDVWWDSGCMPFAQWHAPFENEDKFHERFPADYICEALDQTRGWFYSLLGVSTILFGQSSYRTVLCLGLILDADAQKMSKSKGNVVVPWEVHRHPRRGRAALVLLHLEAAVGRLPLLARGGRGVGAPVPEDAVEHVRVLRPLREPHGRRGRGRAHRPRPLDPLAPGRHRGARDRADGGLRHDVRRQGGRRVRGRSLQLVRAPLAPALLGRRPGRVRDTARVAAHGVEAARAADPVRGRRDLREPRRQRAVGAPMRLPGRGRARRGARVADAGGARRGGAGPRGARPRQGEGAPAAARGRDGGGRPRARRDRALRGPGARRAEREVAALRVRGRRAGALRAEAELPLARAALRQADAARGRRDRRARPDRAARGPRRWA